MRFDYFSESPYRRINLPADPTQVTMKLTTKRKLQIARMLRAGVMSWRHLLARDSTVNVRRGSINWRLDLNEGIDLAIYLGVYQKLGSRIRNSVVQPGIVILDIGANIGAFTLPFAHAVGPEGAVVAIEATDYAFGKLQKNLALNPSIAGRVRAVQSFLTAEGSELPREGVYSSWRVDGTQADAKHPSHGGSRMSTSGAIVSSLDALSTSDTALAALLKRTKLVKLDVDGHELDVLKGARAFLATTRAAILMEMAPYVQQEKPGGLQRLIDEIVSNGYVLEQAANGIPIAPAAEEMMRIIPHGAAIDVFCRPAGR